MFNEFEELENILNQLEELEEAKKHIPIIKKKVDKEKNEIIGKKFNMLTVIERSDKRDKNGSILYKCQCDCGNITYYEKRDLKRNISCGCWKKSKGRTEKMKKSMQWFENTMIKSLAARKRNSNNTSGVTGVSYNKFKKKWEANIKLKYKQIYLGAFITKEEAIKARLDGEEKYFKPIIDKYNNRNDKS